MNKFLFADDISFKAVASQSPVFPGPTKMYEPNNAIDRNPATCMRTNEIGPETENKVTWWKVDLGGVFNIYSINILFRNYDGFGMYLLNCNDPEMAFYQAER